MSLFNDKCKNKEGWTKVVSECYLIIINKFRDSTNQKVSQHTTITHITNTDITASNKNKTTSTQT